MAAAYWTGCLTTSMKEEPDYGYWVSKRLIYTFVAIGLALSGIAILFLPVLPLTLLSFAVAGYFAYARHLFSSRGGGVEDRIRGLVLENLDWDGEK